MPQKATNQKETAKLSAQQIKVMTALLAGSTITKAAESAKVDRTTVHRWLREDWDFQAALNQGKIELCSAATSRLTAMAERAVEIVEEAIQSGDLRASLAVLKGLGILGKLPDLEGRDDPETLEKDAQEAAFNKENDREFMSLFTM